MARNCDCAGGCGPERENVIALTAADDFLSAEQAEQELAAWKKALHEPAGPRVYHSDKHTDARMPLGGIGTGCFEIGPDGRFTTWQLFNTLRDGYVPFFFAVRAGGKAKLLQTVGGPNFPKVAKIEMQGDYPIATLKYVDKELPVRIQMQAFSPFAPLDSKVSSLPVACFVFKILNPTKKKQTVSLAALIQNPIGYDAMGVGRTFNDWGFNEVGERLGNRHPNFGSNSVGTVQYPTTHGAEKADAIVLSAIKAMDSEFKQPTRIFTNANPNAHNGPERPKNLTVLSLEKMSSAELGAARDGARALHNDAGESHQVIWILDPAADLNPSVLRKAHELVGAGATLVLSGRQSPLLDEYGKLTQGRPLDRANFRPDILFEDFEGGYEKWWATGMAFGDAPAHGTLPNQQSVTGFLEKGLVNTYLGGDDTTGKLVSQTFKIERNYIRFLIGGGGHANTQLRLLVDSKIVRAAAGKNNEKLEPAHWDVREFVGRSAHIEIVDEQTGGWGHINVDQIEFSDLPGSTAALEALEDLLPIRFKGIKPGTGRMEFEDLDLVSGARLWERTHLDGLAGQRPRRNPIGPPNGLEDVDVYMRPVGKGKVMLCTGAVMDPAESELWGARRKAYDALAELAGIQFLRSDGVPEKTPGFGEMLLGTLGLNVSKTLPFVEWSDVWAKFETTGRLPDKVVEKPVFISKPGETMNVALANTVEVPAGKSIEVPFFLTWRYPNKYNAAGEWIGNHYSAQNPSAPQVGAKAVSEFRELRERTERFRNTLYDSTLPHWLLDCLSSQISTIRHIGVLFRTANGDVYGWEGSNGCCDPTCTHVWGYEHTLARLFPDLEREMRRIDYKHQQRPDGGINNRTHVPSQPGKPTGEQPFSDGHASCVLKAYREALNHPDGSWLREYWPRIKKAVEWLISRDAGGEFGQGILKDDQWNTYDDSIQGVNSFIGSYYLATLRAGEEMAQKMGDPAFANRCRTIFERGKENLVKECWNGEYFQQNLPDYMKRGGNYGPGCLSDQLIGQWWAHQLGLGYVLPRELVVKALRAVFAHNWLPDHTSFKHNWRKFAGGRDKGLLICTWPRGGRPPETIPYVDEVWTGVEYQVAAHMIHEGMIDEGFSIIKGARDRYDGLPRAPMPRNPWNEIECGGHYVRAMSSWSILLALSGFHYDSIEKSLRFTPRHTPDNFKSFFTAPECYGTLTQTRGARGQRNSIHVVEGKLALSRIHIDPPGGVKSVVVSVGRARVPSHLRTRMDGVEVALELPVVLRAGEMLTVA